MLILILIILIIYKKKEFLTNDEAIQAVASIYNSSNMVVTNLNVTGNLNPQNFKGIIVAYSGEITSIPVGWVLCDGTNNTPDLRGRFIFGYNPANAELKDTYGNILRPVLKLKDIGGEEYHTLTIDEMPSHNHKIMVGSGSGYTNNDRVDMYSNNSFPSNPTNLIGNTGGSKPHNNLPPYLVLSYIMKI